MRFPVVRVVALAVFITAVSLIAGCGSDELGGYGSDYPFDHKNILFSDDDIEANVDLNVGLQDLTFVDKTGAEVVLKDFIGEKNVVVVVTRGFPGEICIYCSTQVSRLIARYAEIAALDAQVVVVFPINNGDESHLDEFIRSAQDKLDDPTTNVPFPILLDVELKAVSQLGIRKDLSKPATYIVDKNGVVRFAYVGVTKVDRPSVDAILNQLQKLRPATGSAKLSNDVN